MPAVRRRKTMSFNLAFLDVMFCGFGAVVLLVLILHANSLSRRKEQHTDLRGQVDRIEQEVRVGRLHMVRLQDSLRQKEEEREQAAARAGSVQSRIAAVQAEVAELRSQTLARRAHINRLQSDLKTLDSDARRLNTENQAAAVRGSKVRRFEGEGNRQYLTGLKLGGNRVLLLVDRSASMLDETVVNILRRRNLGEAVKKQAPKWRQAKQTVSWLTANLPASSSLQVLTFNSRPASLDDDGSSGWVRVTDTSRVNRMLTRLEDMVPAGGTSLANVFAAAARLSPRPDNIVLLTDGLPTQGTGQGTGKVSADRRVRFFNQAIKKLPSGVPVNTILFPMEGDPLAAALFWKLAVDSGGSFFTPTGDWP